MTEPNTQRKFTCDPDLGGCGKKTHEPRGLEGFRGFVKGDVQHNIEIEYIDLCEKCGVKKQREQKLLMRVTGAAAANLLSEEQLIQFGKWGKMKPNEKRIWIEEFQRLEKASRSKPKK